MYGRRDLLKKESIISEMIGMEVCNRTGAKENGCRQLSLFEDMKLEYMPTTEHEVSYGENIYV